MVIRELGFYNFVLLILKFFVFRGVGFLFKFLILLFICFLGNRKKKRDKRKEKGNFFFI